MNSLKILNSRETKEILNLIKRQWGADFKSSCVFLENNKNHIFIVSKDISKIDFSKIKINSAGLYIAELRNNELRLSMEGSQLVGPLATKNVVEVSEEEARRWLAGEDLEAKADAEGYVIIRHNHDFLGCGRLKENRILNFVPKVRRVQGG